MANHIIPKIILAFCLGSSVCFSQSPQTRKNIICLVDFSQSVSTQMTEAYIDVIKNNVIASLWQFDEITILPIDEGAKKTPTKIIEEDISKITFSKHTDGFTHAHDSTARRLRAYTRNLATRTEFRIREEKSKRKILGSSTDILSAIEQARQVFEFSADLENGWQRIKRFLSGKSKTQSVNILLIFSDMIQESDAIDFNKPKDRPEGCPPQELNAIIQELKIRHKLPTLNGCEVIVFGRTGLNNIQVDNNEAFWITYFQKAEANLNAYGYDTRKNISTLLSQSLPAELNKSQPPLQDLKVSDKAVIPIEFTELKKTFSGSMTSSGRSQFVVLKITEFTQANGRVFFTYTMNSGGFRNDGSGEYLLEENALLITPQIKCFVTRNEKGKILIHTSESSSNIKLILVEK